MSDIVGAVDGILESLPTRERGLKCFSVVMDTLPAPVAPYAGAWIEISPIGGQCRRPGVAPYAGAWFEI